MGFPFRKKKKTLSFSNLLPKLYHPNTNKGHVTAAKRSLLPFTCGPGHQLSNRQLQKDLPNANKQATPNPLPSPALPRGYPGWSHSLPGTIQSQRAVFMLHFEAFQLWPEQLPRLGPLAGEDMDACWRSLPLAGTLPALG